MCSRCRAETRWQDNVASDLRKLGININMSEDEAQRESAIKLPDIVGSLEEEEEL